MLSRVRHRTIDTIFETHQDSELNDITPKDKKNLKQTSRRILAKSSSKKKVNESVRSAIKQILNQSHNETHGGIRKNLLCNTI